MYKSYKLEIVMGWAEDFSRPARDIIRRLCELAYEEDFSDLFDRMDGGKHLVGFWEGRIVSHVAWVPRMLEQDGLPPLRTAYVEALATLPGFEGQGYATLMMREVAEVTRSFDLAALSPSEPGFYARLGWELWRGPLAIRGPEGVLATPDDEQVMILRTPTTPALNLDARLTAEWRKGELW